jgi:hypothetical protein
MGGWRIDSTRGETAQAATGFKKGYLLFSLTLPPPFSIARDECFEFRKIDSGFGHDFSEAAAALSCEEALQFLLAIIRMIREIHYQRFNTCPPCGGHSN